MRFFGLLWLSAGCAYISDSHEAWRLDPDDDGVSITEDCNDDDGTLGAPSPWYVDKDEDGFGDTLDVTYQCVQPDGHVAVSGDCDDSNSSVFPDAVESCDGADNNCDGSADEGLEVSMWFVDADGDGYGNPDDGIEACGEMAGFTLNGDDCDDTDPTWHDMGPVEIPYNGIDDNCDGLDGDGDRDIDGYWSTEYHTLVVNGGGVPMDVPPEFTGDCDDNDDTIRPGAFENWYDGVDSDCDGRNDCDHDGDGYEADEGICTPEEPDCNDLVADVNPGAVEWCSTTVDDDCDGSLNAEDGPDCTTYFLDFDGDSFGSDDTRCTCASSFPFSALVAGDCDATDGDVFPGAFDFSYDGIDSDCAGGDDYDIDGDGFVPTVFAGLETAGVEGTGMLPGGDCNDENPLINPAVDEDCRTATDDDCSGSVNGLDALACLPFYGDFDEDGYGDTEDMECWCEAVASHPSSEGGDCVDNDPSYNPGVVDTWYDAEDTDCAGDDDFDADGDGYFSALHSEEESATFHFIDDEWVEVETATEGRLGGGDCDDNDADTSPDAVEVCDGLDNDCNELIDDEVEALLTLFEDVDGDGFGDPEVTEPGCGLEGFVVDSTDCDDGDSSIFPGAEEVCDDIDQDCDGDLSETFTDLDDDALPDCVDPVEISALAYGELSGMEGSQTGRSLLIGLEGTLYVGAPGGARVYVLDSEVGVTAELEAVAATIVRTGAEDFGFSLAELPGDSEMRLVVGSPSENTVVRIESPSEGGLADYVPGVPSSDFRFAFLSDAPAPGDEQCGYALATGQVGADGGDGLIVGCPQRPSGGFSWIDSAWTTDVSMNSLGSRLGVDIAFNENFGVSIDTGDFNGDGIQDTIIGASHDDLACVGSNCGGAYLYFGPFSLSEFSYEPDGFISGSEPDDSLGAFVGTAPDMDGDGIEDLLIATNQGWTGEVTPKNGALLLLSGATFEGVVTEDAAFMTLLGTELGAGFGSFAVVVPDVEGDGADELLVSAFNSDVLSTDGGAVYAVSGPWTGGTHVVPGVVPAVYGDSGVQLGISMAVGDIGSDGSVDIAISGHGVDKVWLIEPEALFLD
jgi:hypothetical protein